MQALDSLVKEGKVRALGASAMYGYQFMNMQQVAKDNNFARFEAMENHYNLLYREDERELIPICKQQNVSLMPYSPLAAGHLSRNTWNSESIRSKTDKAAAYKYNSTEDEDLKVVHRVFEIAQKYNVKMSEIALAWMWKKGIASPIIGATKAHYLDEAVNALNVNLTDEDVAYLEELYQPHKVVGAIDKNPPLGTLVITK